MEINLVTTKKKLSKSLVNQMKKAGVDGVIDGVCLGYVVNVVKNSYKSLLILYKGEYLTFPCNYTKGEKSIHRRVGKWSSSIKIENPDIMDFFWDSYQNKIEHSKQIYI